MKMSVNKEKEHTAADDSPSLGSEGKDELSADQIESLHQQITALQEQIDKLWKRDEVVAADRSKIWKTLNAATEVSRSDRQKLWIQLRKAIETSQGDRRRLWTTLQEAISASRGDRGRLWNTLSKTSEVNKADRQRLWNIVNTIQKNKLQKKEQHLSANDLVWPVSPVAVDEEEKLDA